MASWTRSHPSRCHAVANDHGTMMTPESAAASNSARRDQLRGLFVPKPTNEVDCLGLRHLYLHSGGRQHPLTSATGGNDSSVERAYAAKIRPA